ALDRVVLEPRGEVVVGALRQKIDHAIRTVADRAVPPQQGGTALETRPAAADRIHRRLKQELPDYRGRLLEIPYELRVDVGVMTREARELRLGFLQISAVEDVVVAAERTEKVVGRQHLKTERVELQIADDARVQETHEVGKARSAKARGEFL